LYIADNGAFDVRMVHAGNGTISTVAGTPGKSGDAGNGGPATAATFYSVYDVAVDTSGNLYIVDEASCEVRKVTGGTINAFAGQFELGYSGDGGPATSALLADPYGVAVDGSGTVYIADTINNRIRTVSGGVNAEYAGATHSQGDGGKASAAVLFYPQQLAWDAQGNMYIADTDNNEIRKVAANGTISTVAGNGTFGSTGDGGPGFRPESLSRRL